MWWWEKLNNLRQDILFSKDTTYLTHNFHPYPAKFIPQIPKYLIKEYTKKGDTVCDPFCGSGTTLVEAKLSGRKSIGNDIMPIATLVSSVKTTTLTPKNIKNIQNIIKRIRNDICFENFDKYKPPKFHNRDHWFNKNVIDELSVIVGIVNNSRADNSVKNFLNVMLSSILVTVSNQHSDTRYAAIEKQIQKGKTLEYFLNKVDRSVKRMNEFRLRVSGRPSCRVHLGDAKYMRKIKTSSVDMVVTSPPYPNVYDYYLYHKHRMNWFNMDYNKVKDNEIGSRLRYSSLRWPIDTFRSDMKLCFKEMHRILKPRKHAIIIMGDSVVQGKLINGCDMIKQASSTCGFVFVNSFSYELDHISRTFGTGFRTKGKKEYVITLRNK